VFSKPTRVSPAMGVALVALAFAVSGSPLAEGAATKVGRLISGSKIKKGSIAGNRLIKGTVAGDRIKKDTLTGKQINESTLDTVTSAVRAQSAATSTNAQRATKADDALALGGTAAAAYQTFATRTIPSGLTVTGAFGISSNLGDVTVGADPTDNISQVVQLPGLAPADLSDETVNFGAGVGPADTDPSCTGNANAPTAPPGKVCLYLTATEGATTTVDGEAIPLLLGSRAGFVVRAQNISTDAGAFGTWAYTAP
jgi:hypothetical protein